MSKVRIGFIGVGNRGTQLLHGFMANDDCEITALCDVYEPYTTREAREVGPNLTGQAPMMGEDLPPYRTYRDFRELLASDDIDGVVIATPDHWHALQTIAAFRAGKDVFVEKPLTATIHEGRRMVEVQKETGRLAGVGLNRRGSSVYARCAEMVQRGRIGEVKAGYACRQSDMWPEGIGNEEPSDPPEGMDWDLWVGPRQQRPYQRNLAPYYFRWWSGFSSQMGNWGVHYLDGMRWLINEEGPMAITAVGTKTTLRDDRTIPDTMAVLFEMPSGAILHFDVNEASGALRVPSGEIMLCGTKGTLCLDENGYEITPTGTGQFQNWEPHIEEESYEVKSDVAFGDLGTKEDTTQILIDDFVSCVQSRENPRCSLEDGHRATSFALLANISLQLGKRIEWDSETETITNMPEANELLHYEYREPWSLG